MKWPNSVPGSICTVLVAFHTPEPSSRQGRSWHGVPRAATAVLQDGPETRARQIVGSRSSWPTRSGRWLVVVVAFDPAVKAGSAFGAGADRCEPPTPTSSIGRQTPITACTARSGPAIRSDLCSGCPLKDPHVGVAGIAVVPCSLDVSLKARDVLLDRRGP